MADGVAGGTLTLADDLVISRMGFGAMQLAGPGVFGPPGDRGEALAVLREAVGMGITHIDTSDFYGPMVVNELIREALHPYPDGLHIVTKVGARRGLDGNWHSSLEPADLEAQVLENLEHLALDALDVVNLRLAAGGTGEEPVAEQFGALAELREVAGTQEVRGAGLAALAAGRGPRWGRGGAGARHGLAACRGKAPAAAPPCPAPRRQPAMSRYAWTSH